MNFKELELPIGNSLDIIVRLLYNYNCIDEQDFQDFCNNYSSGGIIPSNISIDRLINDNDIMIESLLYILSKKDILSNEDRSSMKIKNYNTTQIHREKVLGERQRIDALFDYLKSKNIITHKDMMNSFEKIARK